MKRLITIYFILNISTSLISQPLSIEQTISYLNKLSEEYPGDAYYSDGCTYDYYNQFSLKPDGYFHIDSYVKYYNCKDKSKNDNYLTYKKVLHITDIDIKNIKFDDVYNCLVIPCKNGNCLTITKGPKVVVNYAGHNKSKISVYSRDNYALKKMKNALIYLITSVIESGKYSRDDKDDPFAPSNFKDTIYKINSGKDFTNIKLGEENGVYTIWVSFGNEKFKKKFILDLGASEISISRELERELINYGIIEKSDYIESGLYRLADGSIVSARRLIIPSLKVGDFVIYNVVGSVGSQDAPLLLGKNFLDKFKGWSIDNQNNILNLKK